MSETSPQGEAQGGMTFWGHLDELRTVIVRALVVTAVAAAVAFCMKEELFAVVLAPAPAISSLTG